MSSEKEIGQMLNFVNPTDLYEQVSLTTMFDHKKMMSLGRDNFTKSTFQYSEKRDFA